MEREGGGLIRVISRRLSSQDVSQDQSSQVDFDGDSRTLGYLPWLLTRFGGGGGRDSCKGGRDR